MSTHPVAMIERFRSDCLVRLLNLDGVFTTAATATFIFLFGSFARHPLSGEDRCCRLSSPFWSS
jgi:hypothetical protein